MFHWIFPNIQGIGEPPFLLAVSVHLALREAVLAAREATGLSGNCRLECPATPERIQMACAGPIVDRVNRISVFTELMHGCIILIYYRKWVIGWMGFFSVYRCQRRKEEDSSVEVVGNFFYYINAAYLKTFICILFHCWNLQTPKTSFEEFLLFSVFACSIYIYII